jgi:DNA-binding MarR family transcriptional regulator
MGFLNVVKKLRNPSEDVSLTGDTMVALTDDGKRMFDQMMIKGKAHKVLAILDEHSPRSISDISRECEMNYHRIKGEVDKLRRQNMVRVFSYGS